MGLRGKKIVVVGGGNGTGVVLSALSGNGAELAAIVSMADDGGSTGRLRREYGVSAVGDIRQCLGALSESATSKKLFSYRFTDGELKGHAFGNIFLSTIERESGSIYKAIDTAKRLLDIKAEIVPVTDDKPNLIATLPGDKRVKGIYEIANIKFNGEVADFELSPTSHISKKADELLGSADLIIIAPGNFYCSIIPALITKGVVEAIKKSSAKKIFIANLVNFINHTRSFGLSDYLNEIYDKVGLGSKDFDWIVANDRYDSNVNEDVDFVRVDLTYTNPDDNKAVTADLISKSEAGSDPNDEIAKIRSKFVHDKDALNKIITQLSN